MIEINVTKNSLVASGHALFADKGKDIVCASVSAIIMGGINAFNKKDIILKIDNKKNVIAFTIKKLIEKNENILYTMSIQLKVISKSYPKYVKVVKGEKNDNI